jgi:hypothetical protein
MNKYYHRPSSFQQLLGIPRAAYIARELKYEWFTHYRQSREEPNRRIDV